MTQTFADGDEARVPSRAYLFLALHAHRPRLPGAAFALDHTLVLGGGERTGAGTGRIDVDDPWASTEHARLVPTLGRWQLEDAGSKNGTLVNGRRVQSQILADGDVIEIGHSFFMFRAAVETTDDSVPEVDGLATILPPLRARFATLVRVARSIVPILLHGETGTGKEVIATAVHRLSGRSGPLLAFNCGALAEALVHAELFGHRAGAFSGATEDRPGLIRTADRGTLFLDEVAELSSHAQVALLRVLEQHEVLPVGGTRMHAVDVRVVAATHRDLRGSGFREDLYNRLAGFTFTLPPLRERREDMSLFVGAMLERLGATDRTFTPAAARLLLSHPWPGNLRQLAKCLETAVVISSDGAIGAEHLAPAPAAAPLGSAPLALDADDLAQRAQLEELLRRHTGNVTAVARELGKAPVQIRRWLKRYGLDPRAYRA